MSSATYTVTRSLAVFPQGQPDAVTVRNLGPEIIYLDSAPMPDGSEGGYPLGVSSSLVWDAKLPLYASAPVTTKIHISENAGNLFDPASIAGEIISAGLADDIADAIALNGAPPVTRVDELYQGLIPGGGLTLDVSTYTHLFINSNANGLRVFEIQWMTPGIIVGIQAVSAIYSNNLRYRVLGPTAKIVVTGGSVNTVIYGVSTVAAIPPGYEAYDIVHPSTPVTARVEPLPGHGYYIGETYVVSPTTGNPSLVKVPYRSGRNTLYIYDLGVSASPATFWLSDSTNTLSPTLTITNASSGSMDLYVPPGPVYVNYDLVGSGAQTSFKFALVPTDYS